MNANTPQPPARDAHSPTPWKIGSSNEVFPDGEGDEAFSEWLNIEAADGKVVCELPDHSQYARGSEVLKIEDANAALIVEAVNTHAANLATISRMCARVERGEFSDNCPFCLAKTQNPIGPPNPMCHLCEIESRYSEFREQITGLRGLDKQNESIIAALVASNKELREALENLIDACDGNYSELVAECRAALAKGTQ